MFRIISAIGFLATFLVIAYVYWGVRLESGERVGVAGWVSQQWKSVVSALLRLKKIRFENMRQDLKRPVYFLTVVSFIILTLTGFLPALFLGKPVSGFGLLLHALAAPVFAVGVAIVCLLWAHHHRFDKNDWQNALHFFRGKVPREKSNPPTTGLGQKISFWLILLFSLPVILSTTLSMTQLFGSDGQQTLLHLHGYSALLLVITAAVSFSVLTLTRKGETDKQV